VPTIERTTQTEASSYCNDGHARDVQRDEYRGLVLVSRSGIGQRDRGVLAGEKVKDGTVLNRQVERCGVQPFWCRFGTVAHPGPVPGVAVMRRGLRGFGTGEDVSGHAALASTIRDLDRGLSSRPVALREAPFASGALRGKIFLDISWLLGGVDAHPAVMS